MRYLDLEIFSPLKHLSSGQFVSDQPWTHTRRHLSSHVLLIGLEGTLHIAQGGAEYQMGPGQAMILFAGEEHAGCRVCEPGLSYYWCHFQPRGGKSAIQGEEEALRRIERIQSRIYRFSHSDRLLCPEFFQCENVSRLIIQMKQLLHIANSDAYTRYAADYCLTSVMIELARQAIDARQHTDAPEAQPERGQMKRFVEVLEWIRLHKQEALSVSGIAERFGYNADYLSSLFKQHTGLSLIKYIHEIKIVQAREMLLNTDMSIRQIAYQLGLQDEKYFIKLFKSYEGMTPGSYRAAYFRTHTNKQ